MDLVHAGHSWNQSLTSPQEHTVSPPTMSLDPHMRNPTRSDTGPQSPLGGGNSRPAPQESPTVLPGRPRVFRAFGAAQSATPGVSAQVPRPGSLSARVAAALTPPTPAPPPLHANETPGGGTHTRSRSLLYTIAVQALLERGQTVRARTVLNAALMTVGPNPNPTLLRLQRLLALPRVTPVARTDRDRTPEYRWLREHGQAYRGQWVAVLGERLVACAPSFRELRAQLAAQTLSYPPLVEHIHED